MSKKTNNNYPVQNSWNSDSANTGRTSEPGNFQNNPAIHNFRNSSPHGPQSNYSISNAVKPPPEMRPPFNTMRHSSSFELQHPSPNMNHSFNSEMKNGNGCVPNNTELRLPPSNFQNNPKMPPPNILNNTQTRLPTPNFPNNTHSNLPPTNFQKNPQSNMPPTNFPNNPQRLPSLNFSNNTQSNLPPTNFQMDPQSNMSPPNFPNNPQSGLPHPNFQKTLRPDMPPLNFPNNPQSNMPPPIFPNNPQSNMPPPNNPQSSLPPPNFQNNPQSSLPPSNFQNNPQLNMPPPNFRNMPLLNLPSNLPPSHFPKNDRGENFEHPPSNQNNFHQFNPTTEHSRPPTNMSLNQNLDPFYAFPPPHQSPMPPVNFENGSSTHQNAQFGFEPPHSQLHMSLPNEQPFQTNPQCFSNLNVMLPPPPIQVPPPHQFLTPPPFGPSIAQDNQTGITATVPNVKTEEEKILDVFLQRFQPEEKSKPTNNITVAKFRSCLQKAFLYSKLLQMRRQKLESLVQSSEDEWKAEMETIAKIKYQLEILCGELSVPSNLSAVQRKLKLIKKKREIKKKLKQEASSMKLKKEQERESLSQEIDKWMDTIKEKNLKQKREIEMQKEADNILSEVKRKIQEAKKALEKLKVFEKLRQVRQLNAEQKGLFSDQTNNFEKKMADMRSLLNSQLSDYGAEEKALQVMLETEQSWQMEREAEWKVKRGRMLQQRRQKGILESLFGDSEEPSPEDPLFLFYQHHNSANMSIENLVQIRHHWDIHLSDEGETIPQQWVVPIPASNPSWEEVCKD